MSSKSQKASLLAVAVFAAALAGAARAADGREGYSYLSYVGGDVSLVSQGEEDTEARVNLPILAGDRLSTGGSSRAEAVLADGNVVRFDVRTDLRFDRLSRTFEADDDRDLLFLERGAIAVDVAGEARYTGRDRALRIDTNDATIVFPDSGVIRVDAGRRGTEIYVLDGRAEVNSRAGRATVRAGEYAFVTGSEDIDIDSGDFPRDRFTAFVEERRELGSRRHPAPKYIAPDYAYDYSAGDLDDYGTWQYVPTYSRYCWRPNVLSDWSPYSQGYWRWSPCGLTWVSYEPWGWLPYHYGTWTLDASFGWCWLPGTVYSPAWVYWNYTPGYVGWCPVGYYGGYYGSYYGGGGGYYGQYRRSSRIKSGFETNRYPHLRGHVDLTQIDRRGWNFVSTSRIAARLDPRQDVLRGDRVTFNRGDVGFVATAPLRVDRGAYPNVGAAIQDATRRITLSDGPVRGREAPSVDEGLTALLRRDKAPSRVVEDVYRRSVVRAGQDPAYHPVSPEGIVSPRRVEGSVTSGRGVTAGPGGFGGGGDVPLRGGPGGVTRQGTVPSSPAVRSADEAPRRSWRDAPAAGDTGSSFRAGTMQQSPVRRDAEPGRGAVRGDDGWRAPTSAGPRAIQPRRVEQAPPVRRDDSGWRAPQPEARREAPPRSYDSPRRDVAPPPRVYEAPRREAPAPPPRSYDAPRREAPAPPPARSYERFESRAPRHEAPRIEPRQAPMPRYEAPRREMPRYEAPRSAPAPRSYQAPAPRSYQAPAPRSSGPPQNHRPF